MKKYYYGIDLLRTISCIGILMMHMLSKDNNSYDISGYIAEKIIPSFTDFTFLFMAISAFGMCCGYYEKVKFRKVDWVNFYKKRYLKVLPFFATLVLLDLVLEFSKETFYEGVADVTLLFGLFPNNINVIGVGWFLGLVFAFYFMFPFFCALISTRKMAWLAFAISLAMNFIGGTYFDLDKQNIVFSSPFFIAGGLVYLYKAELERVKWYTFMPLTIISIIAYYAIGGNIYICLLISVTLLIQAILIDGRCIKIVSFISGISMEIYLSHMVVFRGIEKLHLNIMFGNGWKQYLITVLMVFSGAVLFSVVMKYLIEKAEKKIARN